MSFLMQKVYVNDCPIASTIAKQYLTQSKWYFHFAFSTDKTFECVTVMQVQSLKMDSNTPMGLFYAHKECSVYLKEGETRVQGAMVWF